MPKTIEATFTAGAIDRRSLSIREASEIYGVPRDSLSRLIKDRVLYAPRIGSRRVVSVEQMEALIKPPARAGLVGRSPAAHSAVHKLIFATDERDYAARLAALDADERAALENLGPLAKLDMEAAR